MRSKGQHHTLWSVGWGTQGEARVTLQCRFSKTAVYNKIEGEESKERKFGGERKGGR